MCSMLGPVSQQQLILEDTSVKCFFEILHVSQSSSARTRCYRLLAVLYIKNA